MKDDELMLTLIEDLDLSHGSEEDDGESSARLYGPRYNFEGDWLHGDYVLNVNKYIKAGRPRYHMSWNADYKGEACCSKAALRTSTLYAQLCEMGRRTRNHRSSPTARFATCHDQLTSPPSDKYQKH